jgi:hypothetical protein
LTEYERRRQLVSRKRENQANHDQSFDADNRRSEANIRLDAPRLELDRLAAHRITSLPNDIKQKA